MHAAVSRRLECVLLLVFPSGDLRIFPSVLQEFLVLARIFILFGAIVVISVNFRDFFAGIGNGRARQLYVIRKLVVARCHDHYSVALVGLYLDNYRRLNVLIQRSLLGISGLVRDDQILRRRRLTEKVVERIIISIDNVRICIHRNQRNAKGLRETFVVHEKVRRDLYAVSFFSHVGRPCKLDVKI
jgi:hypothetical protein